MKAAQYKFLILLLLLIVIINACPVRDAIIFPSFKRSRVDGRNRFKYTTCGDVFFRKQRKKSHFFKEKKIGIRANEPKLVYKMPEMRISKTFVLMEITLRFNGR